LKSGLKNVAKGYVDSANFIETDCSNTPNNIDSNKYGAVAFTSHDITNLSGWHASGASVVVEGKVNVIDRTFTCSVTGFETFTSNAEDTTNRTVLEFTSSEGDVFWIKAFDATGIDASGFATASFKDDYLAFLIANKFSTVTDIGTKTLPQLRTAAS
jgi:hypothetical protein